MTAEGLKALAGRLGLSLRRRIPVILQTEAAECGLACLAMISAAHGQPADLLELRRRVGLSSRGSTLRQIMEVANASGLKTRALRLDLENLNALKTPCILHWDMNHFVVLAAVRRGQAIIHDPAAGRRVMAMSEVSHHFTGVALELWPTERFNEKEETPRNVLKIRTLTKTISGLWGALTKLFCFSLLIESVNLLLPVGMQLVMDHVIPASDTGLLTLICLGLLFFVLFRTAVSMTRGWTSLVIGTLIDIQWKSRLFDHLLALPLDYFERRRLGDIQSRFASLDTLRTTLTTNVVNSIIDGIMFIGLLVMMALYGGWLVWVVLAFTVGWVIFRMMTYSAWRRVSEEQIVRTARSSSHFMESLYGMGTLKALGLSGQRAQSWMNLNVESANATVRKTRYEMLFSGGNALISTLEQITLLWLAANQVIQGHITLGMFVAFNTYRGQFSERAASLLDMALQLRMLSLHTDRVADIAMTRVEPGSEQISGQDLPLVPLGQPASLTIHNMSFQFDALSPPLFQELELSVAAGESLAITGPSGQGKTSLMKIMAGLAQPGSGEIRINGINIHQAGFARYRACIATVLQDDTLFAGSVRENITGFDNEPDEQWMLECAMRSNIHEEIQRMPMGYETLISELGSSLSGGQKQRLLIARALYRRPAILFLDEATSHLDQENEAQINAAIKEMNITRVMIAHRPSTVASADREVNILALKQKTGVSPQGG